MTKNIKNYNKLLIFAMLIILSSILTAQSFVDEATAASTYELAKDWRVISMLFTMLSIIFIALAYMFGQGFNIPELKAWASTEMTQAVVTAIIILTFTGVITFLDLMVAEIVNNSFLGFTCAGASVCAITTAEQYLSGMIDTAEDQTKSILQQYADTSRTAAVREGASATPLIKPIPLLQASLSGSITAGYLMDAERYQSVLEHLVNLLSSMYAQQFFVKEISFKLAPIIMAMGIVARSFFITRKLGGLLIAIGVGTMFVFPLMYVFNWLTLNVALYGDSVITPAGGVCPATCLLTAPKFYSGTTPIYSKADLYTFFGLSEDPNGDGDTRDSEITDEIVENVEKLARGEVIDSYTSPKNGRTASSCETTAHVGSGYCPIECRELPYPLSTTCNPMPEIQEPEEGQPEASFVNDATPDTRIACDSMPSACKIIRYVNPYDPYFEGAPTDATLQLYDNYARYSEDCKRECRIVPPLKTNCATGDSLHCPLEKDYCKYSWKDNLNARPPGCGVALGPNGGPPVIAKACEASFTAIESCTYVLPRRDALDQHECDTCLLIPDPYKYDPPIYKNCADLCRGSPAGPPRISPGEFAKKSAEGMVGKPEIKVAASLVLPAYVLPILNITVTLMFIRSLSQILGGDIEIPGVSKIL
ncbi:hypothetical protein J4450_01775 [Candidatus Micrarchaeota archaeon]|nr:hypothetical protein [Candidatus Micrarchaeota archaeon]